MGHDFDLLVGVCRKCGLPVADWRKASSCKYPDGVISLSYLVYRRGVNRLIDDTIGPLYGDPPA